MISQKAGSCNVERVEDRAITFWGNCKMLTTVYEVIIINNRYIHKNIHTYNDASKSLLANLLLRYVSNIEGSLIMIMS
jgi:hypothetical protein